MSFEETTARVENAFRAMMAIGFSADKAEPVFLELMEVYGQNWAYIEKDNYRVFADAMFQRDKAEAAEGSKKILDSLAVEPSKKVMKGKVHVKKMPEVPVVTPKEEPNELTQTCLQSPSNGKSKEIQPIYLQTLSTEKGSVTDGSCSSDVRLKEPSIEASLVLTPRMKSVSNHALIIPKDGPIAQTGVANQRRKRQFTEVARTLQVELMKKDMGVAEKVQFGTGSREGALGCLLKTVDETTAELEARYECLLEKHYALQVEHHACPGFIKILEVKVENLEAMVAEERKHAALIKAEMSRMDKEIDEHKRKVDEQAEARMKVMQAEAYNSKATEQGFNRPMDITERGQFAVDVLVGYNEEVQKLEHRYVDLGKRHQAMKDAHEICLSEIESIKTEKSRLEKRAEDAETLALARDKHLGKSLENFRATQTRLNEAVADALAARSRAAEAREEGLLAGKVEGTKAYLASDECKNLFNWTHVACYDDLIRKVEAGATVEELKADRGRYMKENGLADSDEAIKEFEESNDPVHRATVSADSQNEEKSSHPPPQQTGHISSGEIKG